MKLNLKRLLVLRWTLLHTGAAIGLLGVAGSWYVHVNEEPVVAIPTPLMPASNARTDYLRAVSLLVDKDAVADALGTHASQRDKKHVYSDAEKAALVAADQPAVQALRAGFSKPFLNPPLRAFDAEMPEFAGYRAAARAFRLEAKVKASHGDYAGAVASCLDAMRFASDIPRGGVLLSQLVGIACEAVGRKSIWGWVDHLSADQATAAARRLESIDAARYSYADTLQEEKWCEEAGLLKLMRGRNTFQMTTELIKGIEGDSDTDDPTPGTFGQYLELDAMVLPYSKRDIVEGFARSMNASTELARLPYQRERRLPPPFMPKDPISQIILPVYSKGSYKVVTEQMRTRLLIAALALRAYRVRRHGANPASLDDLVSEGILARVPADPFSMTGAAPFGYRRLTDRTCRLYSVGPDGVDDGGRAIDNRVLENGREVQISATDHRPTHRDWPAEDDKGDWVVGVDNVPDAEN